MKTCVEFSKHLYNTGLESLKNTPRTDLINIIKSDKEDNFDFLMSPYFLSHAVNAYAQEYNYKTNILLSDTVSEVENKTIIFLKEDDILEQIDGEDLLNLINCFDILNLETFPVHEYELFAHNLSSRSQTRESQSVVIQTDLINLLGKEILYPIQYHIFNKIPIKSIKSYTFDVLYSDRNDPYATTYQTILSTYNILESYLTQFNKLECCDYIQQNDIDLWIKELKDLHSILYPVRCRVEKNQLNLFSNITSRLSVLMFDKVFWLMLVIINVPLALLVGVLMYIF